MEKEHNGETGIIAGGQTDSLEVIVLGKDRWEEISGGLNLSRESVRRDSWSSLFWDSSET